MSFPRYPKYKVSGVEWLGDVPEHWGVVPIKWLSPVKRGASPRPIDDPKYFDEEGEYAWVRIADVSACDGDLTETTQRLSQLGSSLSVKIAPGELFVSIAGTVGKPCIAAIKACIHDGFVYFPTLEIDPRFLYRIFEAGVCYGGLGKWGTQLNLNTDTVGSIRLAVPPADELNQVLEFLDRETGKIDALVAEQRRLMELLKEKRRAVISHAVTKGLNPHAPMKPSGIEWLGDVPLGWASGRLRYFTELIVDGTHHSPQSLPSGDYLYITAKNIKEHGFDFSEITYLTELQHREIFTRCPVRKGDVLYIKDGATAGIAMVNPIIEEFSLLSSVALIRTIQTKLIPEFIAYQLNASQFKNPALNGLVGGAMTRFTLELISRFEVSMPPLEEQRAIVAQLDLETAKFDTLTAEAQRAIDFLQERRTALISAAVTGQIDVRPPPKN